MSNLGRILLVEDDYFVAMEAEHHLRASGFDVVGTATTAEEAIRKAEAASRMKPISA